MKRNDLLCTNLDWGVRNWVVGPARSILPRREQLVRIVSSLGREQAGHEIEHDEGRRESQRARGLSPKPSSLDYFHCAMRFFASSDRYPINSLRASGAVSSRGASTFVSHVLKSDADEKVMSPTRSRSANLWQRSMISTS